MSYSNIAKFAVFVIAIAGATLPGCSSKANGSLPASEESVYSQPRVVGRIANPDIREASGIAASKCQAGVFWTHNDSGDDAFIFAINANGENLGTWRVGGARNDDWEDIATYKDAAGKCYVYVGDIGDNKTKRDVRTIYRVAEPTITPADANSTSSNARETAPAEKIDFAYADASQNAETLLVHPQTGDIYVLTKSEDKPSGVYKIAPNSASSAPVKATRLAELKVPAIPYGLLTGGDIAPDGRSVVLCDYAGGYEIRLPNGAANFDDIWSQKPIEIDLGSRDTGEAIGYSMDGRSVFATTEKKNAPIIELRRRN